MAGLELYFLGPLDMRSGGRPLPRPPTAKSQSLLAYLALHRGRPQPRDRLIGLFWGERPEHNARRSLSTALWHIRRCLPDESVLVADVHTAQLDPHADLWLDAEEFEARLSRADPAGLQSALALYRGDLLDGFYDDWIVDERYRLEALYLEGLARLMAAHEAAGDHPAALAAVQRLLARDPLREEAHRLAMRAYCRLGRRNAALEQYERCREIVLAELGAEPAGETRALYQAILGGQYPVGPVSEALSPQELPAVRAGRSPLDVLTPVRLVGRERELGVLEDAWHEARAGQGGLVLVDGEAGVGKTRLAGEFAAPLRWQGARVLWGRCYEFERALPYQGIVEALQAALPALPGDELAALPAWALREVARLVPELLERPALRVTDGPAASRPLRRDESPPRPPPAAPGPDPESLRLYEAVAHVLSALSARAPLLLVLEDLHWASESTLGLLHHLARRLAECPALIVGTFRPEAVAAEHTLPALGRSLAREGIARLLHLERLPAAAVETMVVEMSAAGEAAVPLAKRLYRETEGNPFFLIELVKALFETGAIRLEEGAWRGDLAGIVAGVLPLPAGVAEAIRDRARRLGNSAQDALGLAAVLGREFDLELLSAAWGRGEEAALEALDALLRQRLVEERGEAGGSDFAFTHHLIQEVVYAGLPRARRLRWHACAGQAMEALYAAEPEARAGEMAYHFERACRADRSLCDKAVAYLLQAGQQAVRHSAHREAIAYYRRGLDLLHTLPETEGRLHQEVELQLALGLPTTVVYGYGSAEAGRVYERARELCQGLGPTPALFTALVALARHYGVGGHLETGLAIAGQLLAIARDSGDTTLLVEACRMLGGCLFALGRLGEAQGFCERGVAVYDVRQHESHAYRFGHDPAATMLGVLGMALWLLGRPDRADEQSQKLSDLAVAMVHPSSVALAQGYLATLACLRHDVAAARGHAAAAIEFSQRRGLWAWAAWGTLLHGWALVELGQGKQGLAELSEGTGGWRAAGYSNFVPFFLGLQAEACLKMGRLDEAAAALAEACAVAHSAKDRFWLAELHRLEGELVLRRDPGPWTIDDGLSSMVRGPSSSRGAEAHFRQAIEVARGQEARMLELRAAASLARLWRGEGRIAEARQVLAEVVGRFEGLESYDLKAACALLRTLG